MQRVCIYDNCWLTWIELPVWGLHLKDYHSTDDMTVDIGHVNYGNYPLVVKNKNKKQNSDEFFSFCWMWFHLNGHSDGYLTLSNTSATRHPKKLSIPWAEAVAWHSKNQLSIRKVLLWRKFWVLHQSNPCTSLELLNKEPSNRVPALILALWGIKAARWGLSVLCLCRTC